MAHAPKNFSNLLGKLKGISDKQLEAHFGLYNGYVKKLNEIDEKLQTADPTGGNYSFNEFSELARRRVVAFNGTFLHELYFENLSGTKTNPSEELKAQLGKDFGSFERFNALMKGYAVSTPGWVLLVWNCHQQRLSLDLVYEHHIGLSANSKVICALDCWEHAFMIDYGTNKGEYVKAFTDNLNWDAVNKRFEKHANTSSCCDENKEQPKTGCCKM